MALPENPITRNEKYLNAIATGNKTNLPEPITREEMYLEYIAENGSGGGSGVVYKIKGAYDTLAELKIEHPVGNEGDAYLVGTPSHVYAWLVDDEEWYDAGAFTAIEGPKGDTGETGPKGQDGAMAVTVTQIQTTGTKIAKIDVDGTTTELYAPTGGGGTGDYDELTNKPSINDVELSGNKTSSDLGLVAAESGKGLSSNDYTTAEKQAVATIGDKVDKVTGKGLSTEDYTSTEKTKLGGIEAGAEVNTIKSISVNGTPVVPDGNKNVAITVITNAVNDLVNYYLKSETYTQSEVDALISAVSGMHFEAVSSLPTTDISTNTIYLVPNSSGQTQNIKDEYINLDGTSAGWELIGNTTMDLTNYVQKSSTAGLLKNDGTIDTNTYALASVVTAILDGVSIDSFGDVETALNGKADKSEMSVTDGTGADADKTTIQLKSGTSATVLKTHQDITGKQDKTQYSTMPTAGADYVGKIVQYVGTTDSTYTNGYFYKCVENSGSYSWETQSVQAGGSATIPIASSSTLGGIKIGDGLSVEQDGTASVDSLTTAQVNALLALLN